MARNVILTFLFLISVLVAMRPKITHRRLSTFEFRSISNDGKHQYYWDFWPINSYQQSLEALQVVLATEKVE